MDAIQLHIVFKAAVHCGGVLITETVLRRDTAVQRTKADSRLLLKFADRLALNYIHFYLLVVK